MTSAEQDDTFPKCQHLLILKIIIFGISFFFFKAIQRQILPTLPLTTEPVLRVEVGVSVGI